MKAFEIMFVVPSKMILFEKFAVVVLNCIVIVDDADKAHPLIIFRSISPKIILWSENNYKMLDLYTHPAFFKPTCDQQNHKVLKNISTADRLVPHVTQALSFAHVYKMKDVI